MMLLAQTDFYYANRGMGWGFDGTYVLIILAFFDFSTGFCKDECHIFKIQ